MPRNPHSSAGKDASPCSPPPSGSESPSLPAAGNPRFAPLSPSTLREGDYFKVIVKAAAERQDGDGADGSLYVGPYVEGERCGKGILKHLDGSKYTGDFKNDLQNGQGKFIEKDGTMPGGLGLEGWRKEGLG